MVEDSSLPIDTDRLIGVEAAKRRTFAIISHPDAGKTTLTEKLLLYAGMMQTAGMVRGRKNRKATSSDWMQMEQERGISITASAMQFHYKGAVINVLDTPGHQDFSEDTYRTLTAADSAVMVLDAAKGIEEQTVKLFKVCRMRGVPILTFVNKLDLPTRDPLDLLAEIESVLGIQAHAFHWPAGTGKDFRGVVCRTAPDGTPFPSGRQPVLIFDHADAGGSRRVDFHQFTWSQALESKILDDQVARTVSDELALLDEAGNPFDKERFLRGELTPVFFGSALTNFGVEPFFDAFRSLAPAPWARQGNFTDGHSEPIDPVRRGFSGYVFKVQANMDPRHRDSMAFLRVCSGKFERDSAVYHQRLGREIRLSRSHAMFGGDRSTVDAGYPGDIIGVVNPGVFAIGDTVSLDRGFTFPPLPKFPPEVVARIRVKDVMKKKSFDKGLQQLSDEGAVLLLEAIDPPSADGLVAAVGRLQFEVLQHRLKTEYNVETILENLPYRYGAWLTGDPKAFRRTSGGMLARDRQGQVIFLYTQSWERQYALEQNKHHGLVDFVEQVAVR